MQRSTYLTFFLPLLSLLPLFSSDKLNAFIPTKYINFRGGDMDLNFFDLDSENLKWNPEVFRDYQMFYDSKKGVIQKKYRDYSLEEMKTKALFYGFESQQGVVALYVAKQKVLEALGKTMPRLSLQIGLSANTAGGLLAGFLGFLVPKNWFNLSAAQHQERSEQLSYWAFVYNQIYQVETLYITIHKAQIDLEIISFYMTKLKGIIRFLLTDFQKQRDGGVNDREIDILTSLLGTLELDALDLKTTIYKSLAYLPFIMNTKSDLSQGITADILPLDMKKKPSKKHLDTKRLLPEVLSKSLDLQMITAKWEEARSLWWGESFSFFSIEDALKIDFGMDNIARVNMASASIKNLEIKYKEIKTKLSCGLLETIENYNSSIEKFYTADFFKKENELKFKRLLTKYTSGENCEIEGLLHLIEYGLKFSLERNAALHQYYISIAELDRLTLRQENLRKRATTFHDIPEFVF